MLKNKHQLLMKDMLNAFPEDNRFSLTAPFDDNISETHPYGIYRISKEDADHALNQLSNFSKTYFEDIYASFTEEDKKNLPPLEDLIEQIKQESLVHVQQGIKNHFKDYSPINDLFMDELTKFTHPPRLYHFYRHFEHLFMTYVDQLEHKLLLGQTRDLNDVFEKEVFKDLKDACIHKELTYVWHDTVSNRLSVLYTFELNDQTKQWLLKQEDVFSLNELEDLAFYVDDEVLFSSITHEKMYKDARIDEDYIYLDE